MIMPRKQLLLFTALMIGFLVVAPACGVSTPVPTPTPTITPTPKPTPLPISITFLHTNDTHGYREACGV